jgi:hypothetical protein
MATKIFGAISTTGGAASGSLDSILQATLSDGDLAIVGDNTEEAYWYRYESSSTAAESVPQAIRPNDYGSSGVWILLDLSIEDLKVYGNAVIDGTLLATGLITATAGLNITGTLQFDGAGPAIDSVIDDDTFGTATATNLATAESIEARIQAIAGALVTNVDRLAGMIHSPQYTWSTTDTILVDSCRLHLKSVAQSEDIFKWDSQLTYQFGSGGSNAASDDLGVSEWHYLYVDDSALAGGSDTLLTNAQLINKTTAPTWNASEWGWYDGNDRCIGAFYSNSSSQLDVFYQMDGSNRIEWDVWVNFGVSWSTSWQAQTLRIPALSTHLGAIMGVYANGGVTGYNHYVRTQGSASNGKRVGYNYNSGSGDNRRDNSVTVFDVIASTTQQIEYKNSSGSPGSSDILYQYGYMLPRGM